MGAQIGHGEAHLNTEEVLARIIAYFETHGLRAADVFSLIDLDRSGFVSFDEFVQGVQLCIDGTHVSPSLTRESLWVVFCRFDEDRDGKLSVQDFISHLRPSAYSIAPTWPCNVHQTENFYVPSETAQNGLPPLQSQVHDLGPARFRRDDVVLRIARAVVRAGKAPMDLFDAVDANHDGQLSRAEIERALRGFEPDLTAMELAVIFEALDADHNGAVSAHEFCTALDRLSPGAFVAVEKKVEHLGMKFRQQGLSVYDAFRVFDRDGDGALTREEWQRASRHLATELTQDGIEAIFRKFDADGDGLMSLGEFATFFESSVGLRPPALEAPHSVLSNHGGSFGAPSLAPPMSPSVANSGTCRVEQRVVFPVPQPMEFTDVSRAYATALSPQAPALESVAEVHCGQHAGSGHPQWQPPATDCVVPVSYAQPQVYSEPSPTVINRGAVHEAAYSLEPPTIGYIQPVLHNTVTPTLPNNGGVIQETPCSFEPVTVDYIQAPTLLTNRGAVQEAVPEKRRQPAIWERDVLNTIKDCLSFPRSGFRIHEAFERLDTSKSGDLDHYEFDRMATAYYPELQPQQLQQLFATVNRSGSGKITFDEFSLYFA